jgi:hypothetical protein
MVPVNSCYLSIYSNPSILIDPQNRVKLFVCMALWPKDGGIETAYDAVGRMRDASILAQSKGASLGQSSNCNSHWPKGLQSKAQVGTGGSNSKRGTWAEIAASMETSDSSAGEGPIVCSERTIRRPVTDLRWQAGVVAR